MEKKNVMLLTVIAIATLLVAVVGATFAYFTFYHDSTSGTTTIQGTAGTTGIVTMSETNNTLYLNMPIQNMMNNDSKGIYDAQTTDVPAVKGAQTHVLANITSANSATGQTYSCTFSVAFSTVDNNGATGTFAKLNSEQDLDSEYTVTLPAGVTITGITSGTAVDVKSLPASTTGTATITGNQNLDILGRLTFENRNDDQNDLQGLKFTVTADFSNFVCTSTIANS